MNELLDSNLDKKPESSPFKKIVLINLGILALYTIYCKILPSSEGGAVLDAFLIIGQVSICVIAAVILAIAGKGSWARGFILSALLVLLIGFGSCIALWA